MESRVIEILERRRAGQRLTDAEALFLFKSAALPLIGKYADEINQQKNQDQVFYNVNRHINPTNVCAMSCKFCAFSRKPGEEGAYSYTIEEMLAKAEEAVSQGATEVHMVGGLHPRWSFQVYLDMIKAIKQKHPSIHIKAFTAVELDWMARKARITVEEVLKQLMEAGLDSLPGGGAEIFHPEIRESICDTKLSGEDWIDIHRRAHNMGLRSNATMLYGHIEDFYHRVDHMRRLRDLQDETGGFNVFIPLAFQPYHNEMGIDRYTFSYDDLKTLAIARLYLDNFNHIKAYWIMLGQDVAQLATYFGANDLDGTVKEEKISKMAGGGAGVALNREELENLIVNAQKRPVERDTLYNPIKASLPSQEAILTLDKHNSQFAFSDQNPFDSYGKETNIEAWYHLLKSTSLNDLGISAQKMKRELGLGKKAGFVAHQELNCAKGRSYTELNDELDVILAMDTKAGNPPESLTINLSNNPQIEFAELSSLIKKAQTSKFKSIRLLGLKSLQEIIFTSRISLQDGLTILRTDGCSLLEASPRDKLNIEDELFYYNKAAYRADLPIVYALEIPPTFAGNEGLWLRFIGDLTALNDMNEEFSKVLGLSIHAPANNLPISAVDYLKGLALARIICDNILHLITHFDSIPSSKKLELAMEQNLAQPQKLASLCLVYGADDFGAIDIDQYDLSFAVEEAFISGLEPVQHDFRFAAINNFTADDLFSRKIKKQHFQSFEQPRQYHGSATFPEATFGEI